MAVSFDLKLRPAPAVLIRTIEGESLILSIPQKEYYGLDAIGTRMWQVVTAKDSVEEAYQELLEEFDVTPEVLRKDLEEFLDQLLDAGLLIPDGQP